MSRAIRRGALLGALLAFAFSPSAVARSVYVTNYEAHTVSVIDSSSNQVVATIPTGDDTGPYTVAITPDGRTAWVVNYDSGTLISIDTATNQIVGAPIAIPEHSYGIAITPDGSRAYIANVQDDSVTVVDVLARQAIGTPIPLCPQPQSVTITPDGTRAYVACSKDVRVLEIATGQMLGAPIPVEDPYGTAITPDGRNLYVASLKGFVAVIDTATNQVIGSPLPVGEQALQFAITSSGARAYVTDGKADMVSIIDTATRQLVGPPLTGITDSEYIASSPDGKRILVSQFDPGTVTGIDAATNQLIAPIPTGKGSGGLAFVPDQSPAAAFSAPKRVRPGVPAPLNGKASTDPDGSVASWAWIFKKGGAAKTMTKATVNHSFGKPGKFAVTLTVSDNEGCSVAFVFTGQTAYCHGSPAATVTKKVKVAYPGVRVKCPKAQGTCKFKLRAVAKKGEKLRAQSAVAKAKVKPGKKATVSLKPKKKFAKKLAKAKKILVQKVVTIAGEQTTTVTKLKVVQ
jgi:YVTN family beta-propeller protein